MRANPIDSPFHWRKFKIEEEGSGYAIYQEEGRGWLRVGSTDAYEEALAAIRQLGKLHSSEIKKLARLAKEHGAPVDVIDEDSADVAADWFAERGIAVESKWEQEPFMIPEYATGTAWIIETDIGGDLILSDLVPTDDYAPGTVIEADSDQGRELIEVFSDYIDGGEFVEFQVVEGWFAHLSAPGYMDQTEWYGPFETEEDARNYIVETWEVDPDTGRALPDDYDHLATPW